MDALEQCLVDRPGEAKGSPRVTATGARQSSHGFPDSLRNGANLSQIQTDRLGFQRLIIVGHFSAKARVTGTIGKFADIHTSQTHAIVPPSAIAVSVSPALECCSAFRRRGFVRAVSTPGRSTPPLRRRRRKGCNCPLEGHRGPLSRARFLCRRYLGTSHRRSGLQKPAKYTLDEFPRFRRNIGLRMVLAVSYSKSTVILSPLGIAPVSCRSNFAL